MLLAVLEVDRVDDRPAAQARQAGLDHVGLGRVEHDRHGRLAGELLGKGVHVGHAVPPDVVDADVEHVRALADLLLGHAGHALEVALEHQVAELAGAVGVAALPHGQVGEVLVERDRLVEAGQARLVDRVAGDGRVPADRLDHLADVLRGGAAAAAHHVHAELGHEAGVRLGQLGRAERVVGSAVAQLGQAGVGQARQQRAGVLEQVAQVLAHLGRAGGAVHPDDVDAERLDRGEPGGDVGAEQHLAGGLDGDLGHERDLAAGPAHARVGAGHRRLELEQVLAGLDQQQVGPAREQPGGLVGVGGQQRGVGRVAEGGELGARSHRAGHPARAPVGGEVVGDLAGQPGRHLVQLDHPVGDAVLAEDDRRPPERVGLHHVGARLEIGGVDPLDHVRPGRAEDLAAPLEVLVVVEGEVGGVEHRPHGPVEDQDTLAQGGQYVTVHAARVADPRAPFPTLQAAVRVPLVA